MNVSCARYSVLHFLVLLSSFKLWNCKSLDDSIAYLPSLWLNSPYYEKTDYLNQFDNSTLRTLLYRRGTGPSSFACGFYCNNDWDGCLFAVLIFRSDHYMEARPAFPPQVVWSANRNHLVRFNATLQLTQEGDLILTDADGTSVWSTNTPGRLAAGLNLTETGNLVLFDHNNASVWQSFDHPTDSLLPRQKLFVGQKLTASTSEKNWTQGLLSFSLTKVGVDAYVNSNPPQIYYNYGFLVNKSSMEPEFVIFRDGGLFFSSGEPIREFALASSAYFMKLEPKGQLRVYEWDEPDWKVMVDIFSPDNQECQYPLICGKYGICTKLHCSCPGDTADFRPIDNRRTDLGCLEITPLSCEASEHHSFLELKSVANFYYDDEHGMHGLDIESCKQACLTNCSCKAAFYDDDDTGMCYLLPEVFSLVNAELYPGFTTFIKVQKFPNMVAPSPDSDPPVSPSTKESRNTIILGSSLAVLFGLFLVLSIWWLFLIRKRKDMKKNEDDYLHQVSGMSSRFSHEMLIVATENFSKKLGAGGCGTVFEGTFRNGTKIAVKCLEGFGQIKKAFLAEVETIGTIHHINLVRLVGYCAEKSHRLLVYEYMSNGSLDKWIFNKNKGFSLDWKIRKKIILDVAKGLAYLHEECRQKIIHLDIKPQNILLDENFNAKVSDFGLSKLIDRDQSQVVTTMRGTPGYLAPEWLNSFITEKVDVYSFGIVVLETLCGRKNLDRSKPEESMHLLSLLNKKSEEDKLLDLVDKTSRDMQLHGTEVIEMMKVSAWCLQNDMAKRPSMSVVVMVLEGIMEVEENLDYNFFNPTVLEARMAPRQIEACPTPLSPSVLSGPR